LSSLNKAFTSGDDDGVDGGDSGDDGDDGDEEDDRRVNQED
jgi:hypothetical protein